MANLHKIRPEIHILYFPCGNNDAVEGSQAKRTKEKQWNMLIFIVLVDDGLIDQNWPADEYDIYASQYPLQEQKRSVQRDIHL